MPTIPYLDGHRVDRLTAEHWNDLVAEIDRKLSLALDDHSLCFWFQWTDHDITNPQPVRTGVDRFMGQCFFFLGDPEDCRFSREIFEGTTDKWGRAVITSNPTPYDVVDLGPYDGSVTGPVYGLTSDYRAYDHTPFTNAIAGTTFDSSVTPYYDLAKVVARIHEPDVSFYTAAGRTEYHGHGCLFDFSLQCHTKGGTVSGTHYDFNVICGDGIDPEFIHRDAQPELVFDGLTEFEFPAAYDKYRFFRVHNLGLEELVVTFKNTSGGTAYELTVPALGSRCLRRDDVDTGYLEGFNHFQRFKGDEHDIRFYNGTAFDNTGDFFLNDYDATRKNLQWSRELSWYGVHRKRSQFNVVANPQILFHIVQAGRNLPTFNPGDNDGATILHPGAFQWFLDPDRFWDASTAYEDHFPEVTAETLLGDLLHHKGRMRVDVEGAAQSAQPYSDATRGTGYVAGETLTALGGTGTTTATFTVTSVNGVGGVTGVEVDEPGAYTVPPNNPSVSGGSGSGCVLAVDWIEEIPVTFDGYATIADVMLAAGVTVTEVVDTMTGFAKALAYEGADDGLTRRIVADSSNLLASSYCDNADPDDVFTWDVGHFGADEARFQAMIPFWTQLNVFSNRAAFDELGLYGFTNELGANPLEDGVKSTGSFTYTEAIGGGTSSPQTFAIADMQFMPVAHDVRQPIPFYHETTVADLKLLNFFGNPDPAIIADDQENAWTEHLSKNVKLTGFGLHVFWENKMKLEHEYLPSRFTGTAPYLTRNWPYDWLQPLPGVNVLAGRTLSTAEDEVFLTEKKRVCFLAYGTTGLETFDAHGFPLWTGQYVSDPTRLVFEPVTVPPIDPQTFEDFDTRVLPALAAQTHYETYPPEMLGAFHSPRGTRNKRGTQRAVSFSADVFSQQVTGTERFHPDFHSTRELGGVDYRFDGPASPTNSDFNFLRGYGRDDDPQENIPPSDTHHPTWEFRTFNRLRLLVEHYNNLASLINAIEKIVPLSFFSFYNHLTDYQLPEFGGNPDIYSNDPDHYGEIIRAKHTGLFGQNVYPNDCYCFAKSGTDQAVFTALGCTIKTLIDMPEIIQRFIDPDEPQDFFTFPGASAGDFSSSTTTDGSVFDMWKTALFGDAIDDIDLWSETLRADLACTDDPPGSFCNTTFGNVSFVYEREVGVTDDVFIDIDGVTEPKFYDGGTSDGRFNVDGTPRAGGANIYKIRVSSPIGGGLYGAPYHDYFLNGRLAGELSEPCVLLKYSQTIQVTHGQLVRLTADPVDGGQLKNYTDIVVPGLSPAPDPFDGQFVNVRFSRDSTAWVSITDLQSVAEAAGFTFVFQRVCLPYALKIMQAESVEIVVTGDNTGGGSIPKTYAAFVPVLTAEETEWVKPVDSFRLRSNRVETASRMAVMLGSAHEVIAAVTFAEEDADWLRWNFGAVSPASTTPQTYRTQPKIDFDYPDGDYRDHANRCILFQNIGGTAQVVLHAQDYLRFEHEYTTSSTAIGRACFSPSDPANQVIYLHKVPGEVVTGDGTSRLETMAEGENYVVSDEVVEEPTEEDDQCRAAEFWLDNTVSADE